MKLICICGPLPAFEQRFGTDYDDDYCPLAITVVHLKKVQSYVQLIMSSKQIMIDYENERGKLNI